MHLDYSAADGRFVFVCPFRERDRARVNGFRWDDARKYWYTTDIAVAVKLREYAVGAARDKFNRLLIRKSPWNLPLPQTPNGLDLKPWQPEAIKFALGQNVSYLGLDPGLGKTICAAVVALGLAAKGYPVVYVLPPFLLENVLEEFSRWAPELTVGVYCRRTGGSGAYTDVLLVPDSLLLHGEALHRTVLDFTLGLPALLIVDEAHRFKSLEAKRTKELLGAKNKKGLTQYFDLQVYMSGTPMPNRPIELFPLLSAVAPETIDFMSQFDFGRRYCDGWKSKWGWDFSGHSHLGELRSRVYGKFMLRIKKDKLDLPPKIEEIFVVSAAMSAQLRKLDRSIGKACPATEELIKSELAKKLGKDGEDLHIATYRRLIGAEKIKPAAEYIEALLAETTENILVVGFHKEVMAGLATALAKHQPPVITGDTPTKERHRLVKTFQADSRQRLMLGNYKAMGVGFNLQKVDRVILVEFSWVPGENQQVIDRAHRLGRKGTVLAQYMVYRDSVENKVIHTLLDKLDAIRFI